MKKLFLAIFCGFLGSMTAAQTSLPKLPHCGYELIWKKLERAHPDLRSAFDAQFKTAGDVAQKTAGTVYHIPVVFHVVYFDNGTVVKGNVSDAVLLNQLQILNGAYRKQHADTGNLRQAFKSLSADAEIQFYLAASDPQGNPTTGITRRSTTISGFGDATGLFNGDLSSIERIRHTAQGGEDAWPADKYLNIWVADMSITFMGQSFPMLLGIAKPPMNPLPPNWGMDTTGFSALTDGVTLQYQCVGNNNPDAAELAMFGAGSAGRTAVHEVGHYLGLRHIWGDAASSSDACTALADDGIADTPPQAQESDMTEIPHPSDTQNTCFATVAGDMPDLWENYMDYSHDEGQCMFTHDQATHMRVICANQRSTLTSQLVPTGIFLSAAPRLHSLIVYPQPAGDRMTIAFDGHIDEWRLTNAMGQEVAAATAGNGGSATKQISTADLPAGSYFLSLRDGANLYSKHLLVRH